MTGVTRLQPCCRAMPPEHMPDCELGAELERLHWRLMRRGVIREDSPARVAADALVAVQERRVERLRGER